MKRPRLTIRLMMMVMATLALLFAVEATRRRWASFRVMAKELAVNEVQCRSMANSMRLESTRCPPSERDQIREKAAEYDRLADELSRGRLELERRW